MAPCVLEATAILYVSIALRLSRFSDGLRAANCLVLLYNTAVNASLYLPIHYLTTCQTEFVVVVKRRDLLCSRGRR